MVNSARTHDKRWLLVLAPTLLAIAISLRAIMNVPAFGDASGAKLGGPTVPVVALLAAGTIGAGLAVGLVLAALLPQFPRTHQVVAIEDEP